MTVWAGLLNIEGSQDRFFIDGAFRGPAGRPKRGSLGTTLTWVIARIICAEFSTEFLADTVHKTIVGPENHGF